MTVTIFGMGAGGRAMAVLCAQRGFRVKACERFESMRRDLVESRGVLRHSGALGDGTIALDLIDDPVEAAAGSRIVCVATTAQGHRWALDAVGEAATPDQTLVVLSGLMGSALSVGRRAANAVRGETSVFPLSARLQEGSCVIRRTFRPLVAALPGTDSGLLAERVSGIIDASPARSIVETCLSNPNPLIHAGTMLLNLAHVERAGFEVPVTLEGITASGTRLIDALDAERRAIGSAYGYEPSGIDDLYLHISGRPPAFRDPAAAVAHPLQTRFMTEDVPHGLALWVSLARAAGVTVPTMAAVLHLFEVMKPELAGEARTLATLGIQHRSAADVLAAVGGGVH